METRSRVGLALGGALLLVGAVTAAQQRCPPGQLRTPFGCERVGGAAPSGGRPRRPRAPRPAPAAEVGCPPGMVSIAAGEFWMGSPGGEGDTDEHPQHRVRSAAFCMDATEVTVSAYRACTAAGRCSGPNAYVATQGNANALCNWGRSGTETHPVDCVDWNQARNYCAWAGGRLPTEAEWEFAARGSESRRYPWGNAAPDSSRANLCGSECAEAVRAVGLEGILDEIAGWTDPWGLTAPVGSFPAGNTPDGLQDMGGNVWEWTEDGYNASAYSARAGGFTAQQTGSQSSENRVFRGGGWLSVDLSGVRAADRFRAVLASSDMGVGFRCARGAR